MLKENFFIIKGRKQTDNGWDYQVVLDALHPIYKAHFPDNPVTPGVCLVQLIRELVSECYSKSFFIRKLKNVKFLHVLNPLENNEVNVRFTSLIDETGLYTISAVICRDEVVFSKLILYLKEISINGKE